MEKRFDDAEKDAFWDLAALAPKGKNGVPLRPFAERITTKEITLSSSKEETPSVAPSVSAGNPDRTRLTALTYDEVADTVAEEYRPLDNDLVTAVRVLRRRGEYRFYGQFRKDAVRYLNEEGREAPFVHFFSYIPQYSQLTAAQRAYYFYWRAALRRGECLRTEESYFYLFVYEIINLPDYIPPKDGIILLCRAWAAYRKTFQRIDKYMAEWVVDYCLVHALPAPSEELRPFLGKILPIVSFREFYLGGMGKLTPHGANTALAFFSDYRFRDSRYAQGEHAPLFEEHIPCAIMPILADVFQNGDRIFRETAVTHRTREAFCGSLCAHHIRARIEVSYYAIADVAPLRAALTAAVKYAENKLRAILAVKSRLSVPALSLRYRQQIDDYFKKLSERLFPAAPAEIAPYEHLYDAPTHGISVASARAIEAASWDTTRILLPEENEEELPLSEVTAPTAPALSFNGTSAPAPAFVADLGATPPLFGAVPADTPIFSSEARAYLIALLSGDATAVRALLLRTALIEEELVAEINEATLDFFGDVILESDGMAVTLISDYKEEVSAWILS